MSHGMQSIRPAVWTLPLRRRDPQERLFGFIHPQFDAQAGLKHYVVENSFIRRTFRGKIYVLGCGIDALSGHRIVVEQERQFDSRLNRIDGLRERRVEDFNLEAIEQLRCRTGRRSRGWPANRPRFLRFTGFLDR